jgi:hypothetical protein
MWRCVIGSLVPLTHWAHAVRARWRAIAWGLDDVRPRVWRT